MGSTSLGGPAVRTGVVLLAWFVPALRLVGHQMFAGRRLPCRMLRAGLVGLTAGAAVLAAFLLVGDLGSRAHLASFRHVGPVGRFR